GRSVSAISSISDWSSTDNTFPADRFESRAHATRNPFEVTSTPPIRTVAVFTASRRFIGGIDLPRSQVLPRHLIGRVIHRASCECHVQDGWTLIPCGRHAGAVGDEDILTGVQLVPFVEE